MLEQYSATHSETVDQILEWPWKRVERFYDAFKMREAIERLDRQRDMIVASLHGNSVYEENEKADRVKAVQMIEESFDDAVDYLYKRAAGETVEEQGEDIDYENPFWSAAKRGAEAFDHEKIGGADSDMSVEDVLKGTEEQNDLLRRFQEAMEGLDQV